MKYTSLLKFYTATPKFTHAPGLAVMGELMARLGHPQRRLKCVHIAGTNGKGSCAAMAESVLRAAGWRTGLFTSPDLCGIEERIRVNGVNITPKDFARITVRVRRACRGLAEPSYFEKLTAAALLYFAEQGCERVVLEAGLGGRLDATNILETPLCSVIMPIGLDHTAVLGSSLSAIAGEKAGIIKPGCPVVCAPQPPEALAVIIRAAEERKAPLHLVDIKFIHPLSRSPAGQVFSYGAMENISLSLLGAHQLENAAAVIELARLLGVDEAAILAGLQAARWPCRFEYIPGAPPFVLDGAHNPHGAAALAAGLREYFPGARFTMVMGVMADKDYAHILPLVTPLAARFICLTPDSPRALPAAALAARIEAVPAETAAGPGEAIAQARSYGDPVCAFGSLYYIGALRALLLGGRADL